jgi:hypothetical protein
MHFVRLDFDVNRLEEILEALDDDDRTRFMQVPTIIVEDGVWISKSDEDLVNNLVGDAILNKGDFDYKDREHVSFASDQHKAIPFFINLAREVAILLGYEKVHICGQDTVEEIAPIERSSSDHLVIIVNGVPADIADNVTRFITVAELRFGTITSNVPGPITSSFHDINRAVDRGWHGRIVKDDEGTPVALFKGNKIWITFDLTHSRGGFDEEWYPVMIAREIISRALSALSYTKPTEEELVDRKAVMETCRQDFIDHCQSDVDREREKVERKLRALSNEMEDLQAKGAEILKEAREKRAILNGLTKVGGRETVLNKEFDSIRDNLPLLRSIKFTTGGITFETEVLDLLGDSATYDRQEFAPFPIGRFEVKLERGRSPHVTNLSHRMKYQFGGEVTMWDHPHVKDHWPCLGNVGGKISQLISDDKWFGAIQYMIATLQSYNSNDGWSPVGLPHWQAAAQEEQIAADMNEDRRDRIKNWVSYRHRMPLGLMAKVGDKVITYCPDTCPLKDALCPIQGTGKKRGEIASFSEEGIFIKWVEKNGKKVACSSFAYENTTFENGTPIFGVYGDADPDKIKPTLEEKIRAVKIDIPDHDGVNNLVKFAIENGPDKLTEEEQKKVEEVINNMIRMERAQEEPTLVPTIHLDAEDVPDLEPDPRWGIDIEDIEPGDDDIVEEFQRGAEMDLDF